MKNYSTYAYLMTNTPEEAALLDEWIDEREAEIRVAKTELPEEIKNTQHSQKDIDDVRGEYDDDIQPGQIRILSKRFTEDPDVIPYVGVLERWNDEMWLVVPFSQYSTPAISGEMATGINICGLQVIQAWNGRTMHDCLLEKSFLFGAMDEAIRAQALALFRHKFAGTKLPVSFSAQRGSEIIMEADPRRDYVAETIARLRPLSTAVKATERVLAEIYSRAEDENRRDEPELVKKSSGILFVDFKAMKARQKDAVLVQPWYGTDEYALAAGSKTRQRTETFLVSETELSLTYSPEEKCAVLTFYDKDDRPDSSYDGYAVLGTGFEFLGTFKDGTIRVPSESVKNWFQITDQEGGAVAVVKKG